MIIGHIPTSYVVLKVCYARCWRFVSGYRMFMFWGLFGSIAPDLDMFYFHFVDHCRTHHHKYFSHYPVLWSVLLVFATILCLWKGFREKAGTYALVFSLTGFIHLILDTIVGDIWWLAPFVNKSFAFATVPARYKPWWLNFILHWSFLVEVAFVISAMLFWKYNPKKTQL